MIVKNFWDFKMPKKILSNFKLKQFGGKQDWDFDGITNKKDCQPKNTMRQHRFTKHIYTKKYDIYQNPEGQKIMLKKKTPIDTIAYVMDELSPQYTQNLTVRESETKKGSSLLYPSQVVIHQLGKKNLEDIRTEVVRKLGHLEVDKIPWKRRKNIEYSNLEQFSPTKLGQTNIKERMAETFAVTQNVIPKEKIRTKYGPKTKYFESMKETMELETGHNYGDMKSTREIAEEKKRPESYIMQSMLQTQPASVEKQQEWKYKSETEKDTERIVKPDTDNDSVPDEYDCQPEDATKHGQIQDGMAILYHGTTDENYKKILQTGLQPKPNYWGPPAVFLSPSVKGASSYAKPKSGVVLQVNVPLTQLGRYSAEDILNEINPFKQILVYNSIPPQQIGVVRDYGVYGK